MDFAETIKAYTVQPITRQILMDVLKDYKRPFDKMDELVKKELLVQVRRGLYVPGPSLQLAGPEPFLLANHLFGPSYVSLESALSFWGLIPERVFEICSVTIKLSRKYRTAAGRYSYTRIPLPYYSFGIRQLALTEKQTVLIATPEKALCDKIVTTRNLYLRSVKQTVHFLVDDLRIDEDTLRSLQVGEIRKWIADAPKRESLNMLVETLDKL